MGTKCLSLRTLSHTGTFISLLIILCSTYQNALANHDLKLNLTPTRREALDIIIGGDSPTTPTDFSPPPGSEPECPPPPPPPPPPETPCPPPPPPHTPKTIIPPYPPPPKQMPPAPAPRLRIDIAREAILRFKKRVTVDPYHITDSWQPGRNACDYTGFKCAFLHKYSQASLYSVQFNGMKLDGAYLGIDNFIDQLPDVSIFHANSNNFKGRMPFLNKLPYLFELDLSNNKYEGEFPTKVLGATQLTFLDLRFNQFTGQVPPQLFNLDLLALFINNNNFLGELPPNFGSTPVAFLTLADNKFNGYIPKSIGNTAKTLLEVLFLKNQLSGCLPYEIGFLNQARVLDTSGNQLTGPIPYSFACLAGMQYLVLSDNQFYGTVPELVCKLPLLYNFTLSHNYFTEVGPECMKLVRKKVLDVNMNCILGLPNQRSPEECKQFFNKPTSCQEPMYMYKKIPCKGAAAYLDSEVAEDWAPQPQPTLTYGVVNPTYSVGHP